VYYQYSFYIIVGLIKVTYRLVGENMKNEEAGGMGIPLFALLNSDIGRMPSSFSSFSRINQYCYNNSLATK